MCFFVQADASPPSRNMMARINFFFFLPLTVPRRNLHHQQQQRDPLSTPDPLPASFFPFSECGPRINLRYPPPSTSPSVFLSTVIGSLL